MSVLGVKLRGSTGASQPDRLVPWKALQSHAERMRKARLRDLFVADPARATRMLLSVYGIRLDYSKQLIDDASLALLVQLADAQHVEARRDAMFHGEIVNNTERRAA